MTNKKKRESIDLRVADTFLSQDSIDWIRRQDAKQHPITRHQRKALEKQALLRERSLIHSQCKIQHRQDNLFQRRSIIPGDDSQKRRIPIFTLTPPGWRKSCLAYVSTDGTFHSQQGVSRSGYTVKEKGNRLLSMAAPVEADLKFLGSAFSKFSDLREGSQERKARKPSDTLRHLNIVFDQTLKNNKMDYLKPPEVDIRDGFYPVNDVHQDRSRGRMPPLRKPNRSIVSRRSTDYDRSKQPGIEALRTNNSRSHSLPSLRTIKTSEPTVSVSSHTDSCTSTDLSRISNTKDVKTAIGILPPIQRPKFSKTVSL